MLNNESVVKKSYIPQHYYHTVEQIPFDVFQKQGIKALFFDLDNTLLDCKKNKLDVGIKNLLTKLLNTFQVIILSNASQKRLDLVLQKDFNFIYLNLFVKKPSLKAFQRALQMVNLAPSSVLMIGDQLHTDINGANQAGIISILVKPLNRKKESLWTKFNRFFREKRFLKKLKKENYLLWQNKFEDFERN
ncbi:YqeG family HAD IIIA-type phosphatase [Candidatus Phytoplasma solani]|uniref:YqeG family HAD IIIA-type phosphatase n=1 Tax=Candidatus Phytoplasma solani TaxID=69896 RepID=UPI0003B7C211|nr:YqeG family HAD IIIA-type phosphatase [Candidatus Phytoplasma solani]CCP88277.1 Predicted hydrolase [Candidatus Phytoplasma solani]